MAKAGALCVGRSAHASHVVNSEAAHTLGEPGGGGIAEAVNPAASTPPPPHLLIKTEHTGVKCKLRHRVATRVLYPFHDLCQ